MRKQAIVQNSAEATAVTARKLQQDAEESLDRVLQSVTAAALDGKTQVKMAGCFADAAPGLRERGFTATVYVCGAEKMMDVSWSPPGSCE